MTFPAVI